MKEMRDETVDYIRRNPGKSVLIALAVILPLVLILCDRQPTYAGQKLSHWIQVYGSPPHWYPQESDKAALAIRTCPGVTIFMS